MNKDEPETPLLALMRSTGADRLRVVLGSYLGLLQTGEMPPAAHHTHTHSLALFSSVAPYVGSENEFKSSQRLPVM